VSEAICVIQNTTYEGRRNEVEKQLYGATHSCRTRNDAYLRVQDLLAILLTKSISYVFLTALLHSIAIVLAKSTHVPIGSLGNVCTGCTPTLFDDSIQFTLHDRIIIQNREPVRFNHLSISPSILRACGGTSQVF